MIFLKLIKGKDGSAYNKGCHRQIDRRYLPSLKMNKRLISRPHKRPTRKKDKYNRKMCVKYEQEIHRRKNPNGSEVYKETLDLTSNQRNAS